MIAQRLTARRLVQLLGDWRGDGHSYLELSDSVALLARDGTVPVGSALPAERPLAEALGVSRTTVSASYQRLRERGIVHSRQGSGTVIRAQRGTVVDGDQHGDGEIDLTTACPAPWGGLAALSARAFAEHADVFQQIGFDTLGRSDLRRAIADRYTARGLPTTAEQIMVTLGAQHANFLVARTLLRRGDRSLIESPSYPNAREALAATGALVAELPVASDGYNAASIIDIASRTSPRLAYLIPDHHNPTGQSMPEELRAELIATLTAQGTYVLVDETTAELTLGPPCLVRPFAAAAEHSHQRDAIITVGSLGKTVWGGLRVGWIRATPELIARLEVSRRIGDLGTGSWEQVMALLALEQYDEILGERAVEHAAQYRVLAEQVAAHFPEWTMPRVAGGVSTWVDLGGHYSSRLARAGSRAGVRIAPGPRFGSPGVFERFIRFPFSAPAGDLRDAVQRLRSARDADLGEPHASLGAQLVI
ncbi:PLP-dependent aminotransferase family protein [Leucobacter sp. G161]|uniref:MocR-like transcription factor YczR n=1 Tax=Leucobacter sp. G161 TaxID=663704 RepID=UPI00073C51E4|nr:PLP-dependent aminotransferase family protein [Leucobacter sp. G161]KUF08149.1 MocR family transcriptional regulator [Leucobacter sp. G161]